MGIVLTIVLAIVIAIMYKKSVYETFALAMMLSVVSIFCVGLVAPLTYGIVLIVILTIIVLLFVTLKIIKKKVSIDLNHIIKNIFIVVFFIAFMLIFSSGRDIQVPDDFYCWGWMDKCFYQYDSLYAPYRLYGEYVIHPPIGGLWEYFITKTWVCFSDSMCLFAHNIMMIALILPILATKNKNESVLQDLLIILLAFIVPNVGMSGSYITLGKDCILGGFLFYSMFSLLRYTEEFENYYFFSFLLSTICLLLTKRSGIILSAFVLFIFGFLILGDSAKKRKHICIAISVSLMISLLWYKSVIYSLLIVLAIILGVMCGKAYEWLKKNKRIRISTYTLILGIVLAIVLLFMFCVTRLDEFSQKVVAAYLYDLVSIYDLDHGLKALPYGFYFIVIVIVTLAIDLEENLETHKKICVLSIPCMLGYYIILLVLTIKDIGPSNGGNPHVIVRYLAPYMILSVLFTMVCVLEARSFNKQVKTYGLVAIMVLLFVGADVDELLMYIPTKYECIGYHAFEKAGISLTEEDNIYFIDEVDEFEWRDREFYYYCFPAKTSFFYSGNALDSQGVGKLKFTSAEEFGKILANRYNYVYVQTISRSFIGKYGALFESIDDIQTGSVYRVNSAGDSVVLSLIE